MAKLVKVIAVIIKTAVVEVAIAKIAAIRAAVVKTAMARMTAAKAVIAKAVENHNEFVRFAVFTFSGETQSCAFDFSKKRPAEN